MTNGHSWASYTSHPSSCQCIPPPFKPLLTPLALTCVWQIARMTLQYFFIFSKSDSRDAFPASSFQRPEARAKLFFLERYLHYVINDRGWEAEGGGRIEGGETMPDTHQQRERSFQGFRTAGPIIQLPHTIYCRSTNQFL